MGAELRHLAGAGLDAAAEIPFQVARDDLRQLPVTSDNDTE